MEAESRMIMNPNRNDVTTMYNPAAVDFERMKSERERLLSFHGNPPWPVSFIDPRDCARAGFFFIRDGDKVQCAFCRGVAGEWEEKDVPILEHQKHFPRCPFVSRLPVGNIPLEEGSSGEQVDPSELPSLDVCGRYKVEDLYPERFFRNGSAFGVQPLSGNLDDPAANLAIRPCNGPQNKSMVTLQARQKSFAERNWPATSGQTADTMAEAGFYFLGSRDHVRCFYCGGGLCNWEARDDPWVEHARWFPSCTFVILNKGEVFIRNVISSSNVNSRSHPPLEPAYSSSDDEDVQGSAQVKPVRKGIAGSSGGESCSSGSRSGPSSASSGNCSDDDSEMPAIANGRELEEEVRKLREARLCKICMDKEVSVVFLPCGHLVSCTSCATAFTDCALCRQPIRAVVRTYMS